MHRGGSSYKEGKICGRSSSRDVESKSNSHSAAAAFFTATASPHALLGCLPVSDSRLPRQWTRVPFLFFLFVFGLVGCGSRVTGYEFPLTLYVLVIMVWGRAEEKGWSAECAAFSRTDSFHDIFYLLACDVRHSVQIWRCLFIILPDLQHHTREVSPTVSCVDCQFESTEIDQRTK
jgi:hypothetical protein